jgi:hypothetical protein
VVRAGAPGVFVVLDGRARWQVLQLGLRGREFVEVISGASERELVVLNPLAGKSPISDGTRVTVTAGRDQP